MPKIYFYFDESGDPTILGRKGKNLLKENLVSKTFSVGYIKTENPHKLLVDLESLRKELLVDEYLKAVPSIKNLKNGFHANKDCAEIREKVFRLLKKSEFETGIIIARKNEELFRMKFNMSSRKLYKFLVSELMKKTDDFEDADIYFSEMGNTVSIQNMTEAIENSTKTETCKRRVFLQQPSQIPLLQVADYMLWTVFRVYEKDEFRFFDYMKEKINFIYDIFDGTQKGTVYNKENPLEQKK